MSHRRIFGLAVIAIATIGSPAFGQQWSAELQTGRIRSSLDPSADPAHSIAAGIRYENSEAQFRINAGVPTNAAQPYWGAIAGAKRFALRSGVLVAGLDLGANGFLAHGRTQARQSIPDILGSGSAAPVDFSGYAFAGQVLPLIGLESQSVQLFARAGLSHYESDFADQRRTRTAQLAEVQLTVSPTAQFAVMPNVKHVRTSDSAYTYAGATAMVGGARAVLWGTVGQWLALDKDATGWSIGTTLRVHQRISFNASVRQDGFDPLYLTPSQTAWNLGVLFQFSRSVPRAPIPASYANGRATIRLPSAQANAQPRIAGDFNGWKPQPMQQTNDGWVYAVAIAPGVYNYSFVNEQGEWFVPAKYPGRKEDGMGGYVAVLVVQP